MGFLYGWTCFSSSRRGPSRRWPWRSPDSSACSCPAIGPERYAGFPGDFCARRSADRPRRIQSGLTPQRLVGARERRGAHVDQSARRPRGQAACRPRSRWSRRRALALLIILGLTVGRNATAIAANFGAGNFVGLGGRRPARSSIAFGAAMVGSLFSSDAWNNVTFAAAEVQNPKRNLPLAFVLGTGLVTAALRDGERRVSQRAADARRRRMGRTRWRAVSSTPRRIASAPAAAEAIFGPAARRSWRWRS